MVQGMESQTVSSVQLLQIVFGVLGLITAILVPIFNFLSNRAARLKDVKEQDLTTRLEKLCSDVQAIQSSNNKSFSSVSGMELIRRVDSLSAELTYHKDSTRRELDVMSATQKEKMEQLEEQIQTISEDIKSMQNTIVTKLDNYAAQVTKIQLELVAHMSSSSKTKTTNENPNGA